jgi:hypothetical protein
MRIYCVLSASLLARGGKIWGVGRIWHPWNPESTFYARTQSEIPTTLSPGRMHFEWSNFWRRRGWRGGGVRPFTPLPNSFQNIIFVLYKGILCFYISPLILLLTYKPQWRRMSPKFRLCIWLVTYDVFYWNNSSQNQESISKKFSRRTCWGLLTAIVKRIYKKIILLFRSEKEELDPSAVHWSSSQPSSAR